MRRFRNGNKSKKHPIVIRRPVTGEKLDAPLSLSNSPKSHFTPRGGDTVPVFFWFQESKKKCGPGLCEVADPAISVNHVVAKQQNVSSLRQIDAIAVIGTML